MYGDCLERPFLQIIYTEQQIIGEVIVHDMPIDCRAEYTFKFSDSRIPSYTIMLAYSQFMPIESLNVQDVSEYYENLKYGAIQFINAVVSAVNLKNSTNLPTLIICRYDFPEIIERTCKQMQELANND